MTFELKFLTSINTVDERLFQHQSPFMAREFWYALESTGAISQTTGWVAQYVLLTRDDVQIACMPLFVKNHHRGEYVFDYAWAQAYSDHGLDYYPRLVTCVPFSPVIGARVWLADGVDLVEVLPYLLRGVRQLAQQLNASSWHGLFWDESSLAALNDDNIAVRTGCQFLWSNENYADFDGFLTTLTAKRRKMIRAERRKVAAFGVTCTWIEGEFITADDWAFFYQCYVRTYHVRGQKPYLSQAFFEQIGRTMANNLVLQIASADGHRIAAALFFKDDMTLYGRYWGALHDVDCLHFEVCYYQGIDYAIAQGLRFFDPGTQGEHKLVRGFAPIETHSVHWLRDPRFMAAVQDFVARERDGVMEYMAQASESLPYKF